MLKSAISISGNSQFTLAAKICQGSLVEIGNRQLLLALPDLGGKEVGSVCDKEPRDQRR